MEITRFFKNNKYSGLLILTFILVVSASFLFILNKEKANTTGENKHLPAIQESKNQETSTENNGTLKDSPILENLAKDWIKKDIEKYQSDFPGQIKSYKVNKLQAFGGNSGLSSEITDNFPVVYVNFTLSVDSKYIEHLKTWGGEIKGDEIVCNFFLTFKKKSNGAIPKYNFLQQQGPSSFNMKFFDTSEQKEADQKKVEVEEKILDKTYTYKIESNVVWVTYDNEKTWVKVPVPMNVLATTSYGEPNLKELPIGSYRITPEMTGFVYAIDLGNRRYKISVTYTNNKGKTWETKTVTTDVLYRVSFCSFPAIDAWFVIVANDKVMSMEQQLIYKSTDAGNTWQKIGNGPSSFLILGATFINKDVGFITYGSNYNDPLTIQRTEDGGKSFEQISLPKKDEWLGGFVEPFAPFIENGKLTVLVGQGANGDFEGGKKLAKYVSNDQGKMWEFKGYYNPPVKGEG